MPIELIIITGLPSSGKTYRAQQIHDYFSHRLSQDAHNPKRTVSVVGSHHAGQDAPYGGSDSSLLRDEVYNSSAREKTARAEEFSAIKRGVSRDNVVIADCPNYIKGYRYQLWCEAKAASTRCCVVHVAATEAEGRRWNGERLRAYGRGSEIDEQSHELHENATKHGKDVRGNLMPESHTAIYGDRLSDQTPKSRSSSMDAADEPSDRPRADDTMTLKSLYISSTVENTDQERTLPVKDVTLQADDENLPIQQPPPASSSPPYAPSTLASLSMRYESPSPFSRWDTPLFTVPTDDTHPPYSSIFDAMFPPATQPTSKKALSQLSNTTRSGAATTSDVPSASASHIEESVKPHAATLLPASTSASALQLLESSTLLVVRNLLTASRAAGAADGNGGTVNFSVIFPAASTAASASSTSTAEASSTEVELTLEIPPGTTLTQPMLQQLRRKYTQLQRGRIAHGQGYVGQQGGLEGRKEVVAGFGRFLVGEFGSE